MAESHSSSGRKGSLFDLKAIGGSQMQGFLQKKPVGHKSTIWTRRYFVLKEGFLLYYAEAERKSFEGKSTFNIHPKGVIPLAYCVIKDATFPGVSFGINVNFPDGTNAISLGAENGDAQRKWINSMDIASRITLENCNLGETMLRSLQEQNLQLAREKQEYYKKFMDQAKEIGTERNQRLELEEFNHQLATEKHRIEMLVEKLQKALGQIKRQLKDKTDACEAMEDDQEDKKDSIRKLHESIKEITNERNEIIKKIRDEDLQQSGRDDATSGLQDQLNEITKQAKTLELEKTEMETKWNEAETKWQNYLKEKQEMEIDADELKLEISELIKENSNTESELKEEVAAKHRLQEELNACKEAVQRLETEALMTSAKLKSFGVDSSGTDQVDTDVKSLKEFFENMEKSIDTKSIPSLNENRSFSRRYTQIKKMRLSGSITYATLNSKKNVSFTDEDTQM